MANVSGACARDRLKPGSFKIVLGGQDLRSETDPLFETLPSSETFSNVYERCSEFESAASIPKSDWTEDLAILPIGPILALALNDTACGTEQGARILHTWGLPFLDISLAESVFLAERDWSEDERVDWQTLYTPTYRTTISNASGLWHGVTADTHVAPIRTIFLRDGRAEQVWVRGEDESSAQRESVGFTLLWFKGDMWLLPSSKLLARRDGVQQKIQFGERYKRQPDYRSAYMHHVQMFITLDEEMAAWLEEWKVPRNDPDRHIITMVSEGLREASPEKRLALPWSKIYDKVVPILDENGEEC